ncbi:2,4-dihydroxyhept-2-ene-1,7-dioic acid aldolase [Actinomadura darangshiensis]|uniref:2,4-dihydroxyhept-2-ene-1,7-dioic acid aldolase n=2 Tax=Actinomadura darangshiensis TaxID=705336 RepID=A0A4R5B262_9ACTN|nr:2,4-dihydroxyhept-2-ene-1,7-dioic acid aldolase [Actinomadura darangshiensis]
MTGLESTEIAARAGFDFVVIDLEHSMLSMSDAYRHIVVASANGTAPLVRVPSHDHGIVQRVLDGGAAGILVPHVDTAEQAEAVVRMVRFPGAGTRGSGGTSRAGGWGLRSRADYLRLGNEKALCIPQLESEEALRNASAILAVEGVDAVLIGAADLALSMEVPPGDPRLTALVQSGLDAAKAAGRPCGTAVGSATAATAAIEQGFGFVVAANDTTLLAKAATTLVGEVKAQPA